MNGIIVIDKQKDFTSFDVVAIMRGILREKKVGHSGTLDPMATGVLPILVGTAAKAQSLLPDTAKEYIAEFRLGITTDTLDITGRVLSENKCSHTKEEINSILPRFIGDIMQVPPMYSAVQKNGVRLYDLARQGIEVEREARSVTINRLELISFDEEKQNGKLIISCSKGTYIRVICDDIGKALGCGCVMTELRRTRACGFTVESAVTLDRLREIKEKGKLEEYIFPVDKIFSDFAKVKITEKQTVRFCNGAPLDLNRLNGIENANDGELIRVYGNGRFLGLGITEIETNQLKIKKKF